MSAAVREVLDDKYRVREIGLTNSRQIIRRSANAIRSIHRGEMDAAVVLMEEAGTLLAETNRELEDHPDILYAGFVAVVLMEEAGTLLAETNRELEDHPDILYAGFVSDASKEYAEARLTAALAT